MDYLPTYEFQKCVNRYQVSTSYGIFPAATVPLDAFAQLTYRESLRDIETFCERSAASSITWGSKYHRSLHSSRCQ